MWWSDLDRFPFGDGPELADELLALILAGKKTATCWSAAEGEKGTEVGKQWVVLDGAGLPGRLKRLPRTIHEHWRWNGL